MITIIDYGLGNLASVGNALKRLAIPYEITNNPDLVLQATALILPGVGAAGEGMKNLTTAGLDTVIIQQIKKGTPLLGICLGMQLLLSFSEEGDVPCLNTITGDVKKFTPTLKVPQIGWNQVEHTKESRLLSGIQQQSYFYFVNSYYCNPDDTTIVTGWTQYTERFCSIFEKGSLYGVQFHPEKSGDAGLSLLKNFYSQSIHT